MHGLTNLERLYGYVFSGVIPMEPTLMFDGVKNGQVTVIPAGSTDSRIDLFNLTILEDDNAALALYDAVMLITESRRGDPVFMSTLEGLQGLLETLTMRSLNQSFDVDKKDAKKIARDFLFSQGLL